MSRFPQLRRSEFHQFLEHFSKPSSVKFRNNKWVGISRDGRPYTVHVHHGQTVKFPPTLVEVVARDLGVSFTEFWEWHKG